MKVKLPNELAENLAAEYRLEKNEGIHVAAELTVKVGRKGAKAWVDAEKVLSAKFRSEEDIEVETD